jgi:hypothetical protein
MQEGLVNKRTRGIAISLMVLLAGGSIVAYQVLKAPDPSEPIAADNSGTNDREVLPLPKFKEPVGVQPTNATGTYTVPAPGVEDRPRPASR